MNFLKGYRTYVLAAAAVFAIVLGLDDGSKHFKDALPEILTAIGLVTAAVHKGKDEAK